MQTLTPRCLCFQIESHKLTFRDTAKARVDHGAEIVVTHSPGGTGGTSPHRLGDLSSTGSINLMDSSHLSTLAQDVTRSEEHTSELQSR